MVDGPGCFVEEMTTTADADPLLTLPPAGLLDYLWQTKYAPEIAATVSLERQRRDESMVDGVTFSVGPDELRPMTTRDLGILDGFENPFVCPGPLPDHKDCAFFVWQLHAKNDGTNSLRNRWRKGRVQGRIAALRDVAPLVAEIEEYCDRIFFDMFTDDTAEKKSSDKAPPRGPNVHFIASLLTTVATEFGAIDPLSGKLLADIPIPRLLQYTKAIKRQQDGGKDDFSLIDSAKSRCLEEVNQIVAARSGRPSSLVSGP